MKKVFIAALITIALAGCAPATLEGARQAGSDKTIAFTANQNYQQAYRTVLKQFRKCYQGGPILAQGDLYHDIKSGTVSVALHSDQGVHVYQVVDIEEAGDNKSKITGHYPIGDAKELDAALQSWVLRNSTECPT